jgi:hypothetical protein
LSATFTDALAALAPDLFELFHGALEAYLSAAGGFWREAGGLAAELTAGRSTGEPPVARERLVDVLGRWEGVVSAWRELLGAAEVVMAETGVALREVLKQHLERLQRDFEDQASGLQTLIDLAALLGGSPPTAVSEA